MESPTTTTDAPDPRVDAACAAGLLLLVVLAFAGVRHNGYVHFDDDVYLVENQVVRQGLTWEGARWAFGSIEAANWHPLTWLSHMLDVELFGMDAGSHHLMSVALHALTGLLLYYFLSRASGAPWVSALAAALFLVHPLRVESVAWAAERKDVLAGLFWMASLCAYLAYARRPGAASYGALLLFFALGLLSKPMVVTLPFVLLLLDRWPLRRFEGDGVSASRRLLEKAPLVVMALAAGAVTLVAQGRGGAVRGAEQIPLADRLLHAPVSCMVYVRDTVWPDGLAMFYPHPSIVGTPRGLAALTAIVFVLAATVAAARWRERAPELFTGWFWFLITLAPVIGLVQVGEQSHADRYTYLPSIGLSIACLWPLAALTRRLPIPRPALVALAGVLLGASTWSTSRQVERWHDAATLFEHAAATTTKNYLAQYNLALLAQRDGRLERAERHYRSALEMRPDHARAHNNLGSLLQRRGSNDAARRHFEQAIAAKPDLASAHSNLGSIHLRAGELKEARSSYEDAIGLRDDNDLFHLNLGIVLERLGEVAEAERSYERALELAPPERRPTCRERLESLRARR